MAIFDLARKSIALKIVYYGCALCGKTTNLITLHRITDPENRQGLVSIATKTDRTLFFDLLPVKLGQIGEFDVEVKVYTVPGQVHYETTRRRVLAGADCVVLVIDSSPEMQKSNSWAKDNLRYNLKAQRLDPGHTPSVLQWNKRDLPDAVPVKQLAAALNREGLPAHESVATTGVGVVETFGSAVKAAIQAAHAKAERESIPQDQIDRIVDQALAQARAEVTPTEEAPATFRRSFDSEKYRDEWAEKGRDRRMVDQETLLGEAVQTSMELAERLDGVRDIEEVSERRKRMLEALGVVLPTLTDPSGHGIPGGLMARLLQVTDRARGSVLFFKQGEQVMEERETVPAGPDPLNVSAPSVGSAAFRLSQGDRPRLVEDLVSEVFFNAAPPGAGDLASCYFTPVKHDGLAFGALVIYGSGGERRFGPGECEFWDTTALVLGLSLHWRALRRKLSQLARPAVASNGATGR